MNKIQVRLRDGSYVWAEPPLRSICDAIDEAMQAADAELLRKVRTIVAKWNAAPKKHMEAAAVDCMAELEELLK